MATSRPKQQTPATDVAVFEQAQVPAYLQNQGPARGSEDVTSKDMVLPRIEIIQALSPIKDELGLATEGQLYNSATGELIGPEAYFINCYFKTEWLLWKLRKRADGTKVDGGSGGFGGSYATESEARDALKIRVEDQDEDIHDWEIVDTPVHYGLLVDPADLTKCQQIVISMAKTKAKVSRKWNAQIQLFGGDRFSRVYKISTFKDENKDGDEFYNYVVKPAGYPIEAHYRNAEKTYEVVKAGHMRANHETIDDLPNNGNDPIERAPRDRGEI